VERRLGGLEVIPVREAVTVLVVFLDQLQRKAVLGCAEIER
jgi:hypothetical protein